MEKAAAPAHEEHKQAYVCYFINTLFLLIHGNKCLALNYFENIGSIHLSLAPVKTFMGCFTRVEGALICHTLTPARSSVFTIKC